ncbi:MAG: 4-hydroxythreonine-4-phosphate dehydrogenase PdxA [Deltaproteobacteria bacterium]|nr:4-hydroxythreonine-4-phosphate dehydrogenase PdxA [Deltaproteobacteria bacterium]
MAHRPIIGITMGDPAGVGPEIIAAALADDTLYQNCRPLVLGDPAILRQAMVAAPVRKARDVSLNVIETPVGAIGRPGTIDLLAPGLEAGAVRPGRPTLAGGKAMVDSIFKAVALCQEGALTAMVTCPISKALMHRAGCHFDGHTELIAHLTGATDYVMMLAGKRLRVALVTIHCALSDVPGLLDKKRVKKTIMQTAKALKSDFGLKAPRLAVAALNPHAGEGAIRPGRRSHHCPRHPYGSKGRGACRWPLPCGHPFYRALSGSYDAVIAMYHDQGLIPLKLLHFSDAVNVTLGLPIIRTSVDHGTAYDIAGQGKADPSSLKAAVQMAAELAKNRSRFKSRALDTLGEDTP